MNRKFFPLDTDPPPPGFDTRWWINVVEERDRIEKALKASSVVTRDDRGTRLEAARSNDNDRSTIPSTPVRFRRGEISAGFGG